MTLPNKFHTSENISGFAKQQVPKRCQPHLGSNFKQKKIYRGFIIKCFGASLSTTGGLHQSRWGRARQSSVLTVGSEFSQIEIRHSNYKERARSSRSNKIISFIYYTKYRRWKMRCVRKRLKWCCHLCWWSVQQMQRYKRWNKSAGDRSELCRVSQPPNMEI